MYRLATYEYRPATPAAFSALNMATLSCCLAVLILFIFFPPAAWRGDMTVPVTALELWSNIRANGVAEAFSADDLSREMLPRIIGSILSILASAWFAFRMHRRISPVVDRREHKEGLQLLRGSAAISAGKAALASDISPRDNMVQWIPGVNIPRVREVRNLLILGAIGSGKTRLILWLIDQLISRLRRYPASDNALFIHDTTGEIYNGLPMADGTFAILNPDRSGFFAWAMGRDFIDDGDCESAADQIVGQTGETFWGKGGATLFAGCMIVCKAQRGTAWGAAELYDACLRDPSVLKNEFGQYYPPAEALIEFDASGELSKTTVSLLLTYRASVLRVLRPLAHAWGNVPAERQFSFGDWVSNANPRQPKVVIVQRSGRHPEMSAGWIGMVIDFVAAAVGDAKLPVSQSRIRTFVLDEAPALGPLRRWPELLDTGRNKGVSTIAAIQDVAQFKRLIP
jgi:hypothetical protein